MVAHIYRHRSEILLRVIRMRGAGLRPAAHAPGRRRRIAHRQNHLPCRVAVIEGLRAARACPIVRSQGETAPNQRGTATARARASIPRHIVLRRRAGSRFEPGGRRIHRQAENVALSQRQRKNIRHLPAVRLRGRHPRLLHRRSVHGRHALPARLRKNPARTGTRHRAGDLQRDRHHRHRRHRHQPVPGQSGHGHRGQTYSRRRRRRAHRPARRNVVPPAALGAQATYRLLEGRARVREKTNPTGS